MKKVLLIISIILTTLLIILLIFINGSKGSNKVLTIDTYHTYTYNDGRIEIPIYSNNKNKVIENIDSYLDTYISDDNEYKKIRIEIVEITFSHVEVFYNKQYYKYILKFEKPDLNENFYIEKANLNIVWVNNYRSKFKIGSFYLSNVSSNTNIDWTVLDTVNNDDKPQVNEIYIKLDNSNIEIIDIYISFDFDLEYLKTEDEINIFIPNINKNLYYFPIWIEYKYLGDNYCLLIDNHHYIVDYNLLSKSERIINLYEFSFND